MTKIISVDEAVSIIIKTGDFSLSLNDSAILHGEKFSTVPLKRRWWKPWDSVEKIKVDTPLIDQLYKHIEGNHIFFPLKVSNR